MTGVAALVAAAGDVEVVGHGQCPFLWRTEKGTLLCLWASFSKGGYTEGVAVSDNGEIDGHFTQAEPLFMDDGGHGMVFRALDGQLYLTLHSPNQKLMERPFFHPIAEKDGKLIRLGETSTIVQS